jgi:hypothetical protein
MQITNKRSAYFSFHTNDPIVVFFDLCKYRLHKICLDERAHIKSSTAFMDAILAIKKAVVSSV